MIGDRWGVTDAETTSSFACDSFVANPTLVAWRGVTVAAPPDVVWRWLTQVQLAPYSYDWVDNFGRRSPQELVPVEDPTPGSPFTASRGRPLGRVLAVAPGEHLTARIMGAVMTYRLTPDGGATRLVLKIVARPPRGTVTALCLGDLVMARRQLLNVKELAERGS